ncbi:integrase catalytic domain-containing protein [Trichonephila clavipes]|nr:integrase catalytic domain-containing protein [Trichonephila clavipes]
MDATKVNIPSNIDLADKDFGIPGEIDMLIGCELFFELLRPNKFRSPCEKWLFQETVFGYIVVGSFDKFEEKSYCGLAINAEINSDNLNQQLQAFWEIEKVEEASLDHSLEEEICETQYQNTHYRTEEGRYVVQLPLKKDPYCLGNSRFLAEVRLNQLWKKLSKHYELQALYKSFLQEYIDLNHMQLVADPLETNISYFLPHHGVFRPDSKTTKLRYLATRTIQQLARDEGEHYPLAASVTIRDIYMDDILTGSSDFQEFQKLQLELISLFKKAGKLWVLKLEWDEPLSNPIAKEWNDFVSTLPVIQNIHVPRLVIGKGRIIIHGFADASTAAYGAVLYAQSISEEDVSTRLLCSKSRVAPVKPITIPRLELCACVLLPQLLEKRLTQNCQWNHVSSNENPADLVSRGLNASDISSKQLWWHGSDFLREELEANPIDFERITSDSDYLKELKPANVFLHNSRNPSVKRSGQLDYSEVNEAELCLIKNLQASAFQEEIEFLAKSPQALLYCTRQRFWPLRGRSIARKIVHECVVCFKNKPIVANQLMGSLPRERVNPSFPFLHTGIDYCGPFFIRYKHQRKGTYQKIYVAIFVCLASKAVHLEIVSDLTTDAFLATLKRFVARRGKCATISSDNAKNFVGANRELKDYIIS